jgi:hypothetical protein
VQIKNSSNQPEPISIEFLMPDYETNLPVKVRGTSRKKECAEKLPMVPVDSPAMCTRRKNWLPTSPAMNTQSKRGLNM